MSKHDPTENEFIEDESEGEEVESPRLDEYSIISSPNDFNVATLISHIDKGKFVIPGFQRNYVWDIARASRLIESVILGLPIPQIFLYEEGRNKLLVIDGQQRLMSLYYFAKKRFPKKEKRPELRSLIEQNSGIVPENILESDTYFQRFNLRLPSNLHEEKNPLHGLNQSTLGERSETFDFRTIRTIVIKQLEPEGDESVFEIFNRLNSGGVNLRPQEMRSSLYHSPFFDAIHRLNALEDWRTLLGVPHPDIQMKDSEVILRAIAMLVRGESYKPSMVRFLNQFSKDSKTATADEVQLREAITKRFLSHAAKLGPSAFQYQEQSKRLSVPIFESVFYGCCRDAYTQRDESAVKPPPKGGVEKLKAHPEFVKASRSNSADTTNVRTRRDLSLRYLKE